MKLLDFLWDPSLNALRFAMGAPLTKNYRPSRNVKLLDEEAIRRLGQEGIDVGFDEVKVEADKTLSFKGKRVVLYIRDVSGYRERYTTLPRFHISYCRTLEQMLQSNRFERYVVATRDDGSFQVNLVNQGTRSSVEKLNVCQNCLALLGWDNYVYSMSGQQKSAVVSAFTLARFFERYPKDLISVLPTYTADTAPVNDYTEDWGFISEQAKQKCGYQCQNPRCRRYLVGPDARFLHAHHEDGQKYINTVDNVKVLCIACHARQPMHAHMIGSAALKEFEAKFGTRVVMAEG